MFTGVLALICTALAGAGRLGPGDEQLSSGEYFDRVTFVGAAGDVVVIELSSNEFDPYLILIDGNEQVLAQEDDSPGMGLGARITFTLPAAGTYTAIVTSAFAGETGGYHLSISTPGQSAAAPGPSAPGPSAPGPSTPAPQPTGQPRSVTGTVVDTHGRPIAGALVNITPALTTGVFQTTTDANGRYLVEGLVDVPYNAYAWAYVEYGGRQLCLRMGMEAQTDYNTFVPVQGAVRNFVMRFDGYMGVQRDEDYQFGGTLKLYYVNMYGENGNRVEVSFTPTGPLIDGTTIAPFTRTVNLEEESVYAVPPGPYRISATVVGRDGSRRPLRLTDDFWGTPVESVAIDWTGSGDCNYGTGFSWTEIYVETPE